MSEVETEISAKKILLAEDNVINQRLALRVLSFLGYDADVAENGVEVLRLIQSGAYRMVLMDVQMAVMDGLVATEAIRNLNGEVSRIPIIAFTANPIDGYRQKCLAAGMNDFISKPIEMDKFANAMLRWTSDGSADNRLRA